MKEGIFDDFINRMGSNHWSSLHCNRLDLILAIVRRNKVTTPKEALSWTLFYVIAAIAFGYLLPQWAPAEYRKEFIAGWITEYSLSVDNLFVFIILLATLKIKKESQQLVLLYGIMIAIVLRVHSYLCRCSSRNPIHLDLLLLWWIPSSDRIQVGQREREC
jgi:hypothetical protein